jgi:murein DD-endopeptidase MepM/ murein hydrolase activator NlpD
MTIKSYILFFCLGCVMLVGCATTIDPDAELLSTETVTYDDYPEPERVGVYHKVLKGQTIWRIAKAYDVSVSDIIRVNNIPHAAEVEVNQLLLIPGVHEVRDIPSQVLEDESKGFHWPIKGKVIKYFNQIDRGLPIKGIYIEAPPGSVVSASRGGRVVLADTVTGYGETLVIEHGDGDYTLYARNSSLLVTMGDQVRSQQPVARLGLARGQSYSYFQIHRHGREENPLFYLK